MHLPLVLPSPSEGRRIRIAPSGMCGVASCGAAQKHVIGLTCENRRPLWTNPQFVAESPLLFAHTTARHRLSFPHRRTSIQHVLPSHEERQVTCCCCCSSPLTGRRRIDHFECRTADYASAECAAVSSAHLRSISEHHDGVNGDSAARVRSRV